MVDRIASFVQTGRLIDSNLRLQGKYSENQIQLSSGLKSQNYTGIASDSSRLLNLESDYERISQQSDNAQLALDRTEMMYSSLGGLIEESQQFLADLSSTVSGFGLEGADLVNNAQTTMDKVSSALNTSLAGRYLFAGSATLSEPVDTSAYGGQLFVLPGPSVADTTYYQGNSYIQSVEAADSFTVNYGVTADNDAFEKIIRGLDLIITNPTDQDTLVEAYRIIAEGIDESAVAQANVSQRAQTLDLQINDNLEELNIIESQIVNIREVDAAEVSVNLKQLEAQLEASYAVTTDLLKLNLSDYI